MAESKNMFHAENIIKVLWKNWALAIGALTLPMLLALWLPKLMISLLTFAEAWALTALLKSNPGNFMSAYSLLVKLAARTLFVTSLVMFAIVILCTDWLVPTVFHLELYNPEIPFVTCLVIYPVITVMCLLWLYAGGADRQKRECQRRNGYYAGDNVAATLYFRETRYQVSLALIMSVVVGSVEYWYFFARYINSDLNNPDRFFFNFIPTVMYLLSLLMMYNRCMSMRLVYNALEASNESRRNRTIVRYLVFCGDELLLHEGKDGYFDTPAEVIISRTSSIGDQQARLLFEELMAVSDFSLRYCFTNDGYASDSNMIHYAVFVSEDVRKTFTEDDTWYNPYMVDRALASNALAPVLANEIFRLHTITMAWKTYDRQGKRLYPIRHYRPTFRFRDLKSWDVDYDDQTWFDVANNNEDMHFYRMKAFWDNITGVFRKKTQTDQ